MKCWNCNAHRHVAKDCPKKKQSLSAGGATGDTTLSGFFLSAFEEQAEPNSFESKTADVLVTGIDSVAAISLVPTGEILGSPFERDSETGRVYTSATG